MSWLGREGIFSPCLCTSLVYFWFSNSASLFSCQVPFLFILFHVLTSSLSALSWHLRLSCRCWRCECTPQCPSLPLPCLVPSFCYWHIQADDDWQNAATARIVWYQNSLLGNYIVDLPSPCLKWLRFSTVTKVNPMEFLDFSRIVRVWSESPWKQNYVHLGFHHH